MLQESSTWKDSFSIFKAKEHANKLAKPKPAHTFLCVNTFITTLVDLVDLGQIWRDEIQLAEGLAPTTIHTESEEVWDIIKNPKASIHLQGTTHIVPTTYKNNMLSLLSF